MHVYIRMHAKIVAFDKCSRDEIKPKKIQMLVRSIHDIYLMYITVLMYNTNTL